MRKFLLVALIFVVLSCQKESNDIFICGTTNNHKAFYWINGQIINLTPEYCNSSASAIELAEDVVYCAGHVKKNDEYEEGYAVIWINGAPIFLSDGTCYAGVYDICVKDGIIWCVCK